MTLKADIRISEPADEQAIAAVARAAFGEVQGQEIAALISDLTADDSAQPILSLVAVTRGDVVGHLLFSRAAVTANEQENPAAILAPLAVLPEFQSQGIGGDLIREGLDQLMSAGVALVFVLGDPGYYMRHGFTPAKTSGFDAPYPIPAELEDAWMVQALRPGVIGAVKGQVSCPDALDDPKHWCE